MINQNIHAAFKQDTADLVMCIMGSALYIAQPCIVRTEGVEVFFNQIDCFSRLPATAKENTKKYAVYLGEKCDELVVMLRLGGVSRIVRWPVCRKRFIHYYLAFGLNLIKALSMATLQRK